MFEAGEARLWLTSIPKLLAGIYLGVLLDAA